MYSSGSSPCTVGSVHAMLAQGSYAQRAPGLASLACGMGLDHPYVKYLAQGGPRQGMHSMQCLAATCGGANQPHVLPVASDPAHMPCVAHAPCWSQGLL